MVYGGRDGEGNKQNQRIKLIKKNYLQKIYVDQELICISDNFDCIDFVHYYEIKEALVGEYLMEVKQW